MVIQGGIINYEDVFAALNEGSVGAVGLDVYRKEPFPTPEENDPFLLHPNVFSTPHVAGVTDESYRDMAGIVAENVRRLLGGESLLGTVNGITTAPMR